MKTVVFFLINLFFWCQLNPAFAQLITTSAEFDSSHFMGPYTQSDTDSGSYGTILSSVTYEYAGTTRGSATASGNQGGRIASDSRFFYGEGNFNSNNVTATTSWAETYNIDSAGDYFWDFTLTNGRLAILGQATNMTAGYSLSIFIDGNQAWNSIFEIKTNSQGLMTTYLNGTDLGGNNFIVVGSEGLEEAGFEFASFSDYLDLGFFELGDSFDLVYSVETYVSGPAYGFGAESYWGDPTDLTSGGMSGTLRLTGNQPVPEASTLLLLGSGLAGLAMYVSKRKKG